MAQGSTGVILSKTSKTIKNVVFLMVNVRVVFLLSLGPPGKPGIVYSSNQVLGPEGSPGSQGSNHSKASKTMKNQKKNWSEMRENISSARGTNAWNKSSGKVGCGRCSHWPKYVLIRHNCVFIATLPDRAFQRPLMIKCVLHAFRDPRLRDGLTWV